MKPFSVELSDSKKQATVTMQNTNKLLTRDVELRALLLEPHKPFVRVEEHNGKKAALLGFYPKLEDEEVFTEMVTQGRYIVSL